VARLDSLSRVRRAADAKFRAEEERIGRYAARKARDATPLDEEKFRADYSSIREPQDPVDGDKKPRERPIWEPNYYNDEVMAIVADYVSALRTLEAGSAVVTLVNADARQSLYVRASARSESIVLPPGGSRTEALRPAQPLLYFAVPAGQDPKSRMKFGVHEAGTLRFRVQDGMWSPDFQKGGAAAAR
jgi:hypothetical protein